MKKLIKSMIFLMGFSIILSGCSKKDNKNDVNGKLKIYTTIFPLEDFTKKIGGNMVEAESIIPPNVEAHSYEPSTKTMVDMSESNAFIYTGAGIEGFGDKAAEILKSENIPVVKATKGMKLLKGEHHHQESQSGDPYGGEDEDEHGDTDPHVWLDPIRSIQIAENIKNSLVQLHPKGKAQFEKNFHALKTELLKLDKEYADTIKKSPKKEILVSHAAYGYWENRYGIHEISVMGLSPSEEPSQKTLENIISTSRKHNIHYVIFEKNISSKISQIVEQELGAKPLTLNNLESVSQEAIQNKEDYFSLMRENLKNLKIALSN
ncbi:metal ABC transporter solute-binding protein, Zn/Mn family [Metabacillus sp. RGM 3146]|uniref:metal ABC transporter solute-binding protein, Zn/Mn family n=1 Tax=Metabacillus sp. RGM 3146 TaxID=3401092 RepID=UPI003B9CED46